MHRRYYWVVGVVALCAVSLQVGIWGLNFIALFCKSGIALLTGRCYNLCKTVSVLCHKPQIFITWLLHHLSVISSLTLGNN